MRFKVMLYDDDQVGVGAAGRLVRAGGGLGDVSGEAWGRAGLHILGSWQPGSSLAWSPARQCFPCASAPVTHADPPPLLARPWHAGRLHHPGARV